MKILYPCIEPFRTGTLKVSDLHTIFYEEAGNKNGYPALFLHGGPGVGILPAYRRFFNPDKYHIILPDQRGAGQSTPHAELKDNTTWDLVEDLEKLRRQLGIEKWLVMGGSWGSTLALAYAVTYPESVSGLIIRGVFLGRSFEISWLHQPGGTSQIFPDEWERYIAPLPKDGLDNTVKAYYNLLTDEDHDIRLNAARSWSRWEAAIMTLIPDMQALDEMTDDNSALSIGRIECHYTLNNFFMPTDNYLLEKVDQIKDIPCWIVQGRYDVICPMVSAWDLHKKLSDSRLIIVPDGSHSPLDEGMIHALIGASDEFSDNWILS